MFHKRPTQEHIPTTTTTTPNGRLSVHEFNTDSTQQNNDRHKQRRHHTDSCLCPSDAEQQPILADEFLVAYNTQIQQDDTSIVAVQEYFERLELEQGSGAKPGLGCKAGAHGARTKTMDRNMSKSTFSRRSFVAQAVGMNLQKIFREIP